MGHPALRTWDHLVLHKLLHRALRSKHRQESWSMNCSPLLSLLARFE